jgi:hypothetical protein
MPVNCKWSCRACGQKGAVSVHPYPHESPAHTAERHQRQTRDRCVKGCLYKAAATPAGETK